jgi:hypothetical protein
MWIPGWIFRGQATATAVVTALFGSWPDSSVLPSEVILIIVSSSAAGLQQGGGMVVTIVQKIRNEGRPCHQVVAPGLLSCRWAQGTVYGPILVAAMIVWRCGGDGWKIGLTASLVSQFFSRELCRKWDSLLAKISVRVSRVSRVSQEGKNAIYQYCQACESRICETHKQAKS